MRNIVKTICLLLLFLPFVSYSQSVVELHKYRLGDGVTMSSKNGNYNINLRGFVQTQTVTHIYENEANETQSLYRIRRARLRLSGDVARQKLSYVLGLDYAEALAGDDEANTILRDAAISYAPTSNWSFTFGQRSVATDPREMTIGSQTLAFADRSRVASAFSTVREVGLFIDGTIHLNNKSLLRPTLVITDGDGSFTTGERTGGLKYGGRINYLPLGRFREYGEYRETDLVRETTPKLSVGTAFSYNRATSDRRGGRSTGGQMYLDSDDRVLLPSYTKFIIDFIFKYRGLSVVGEFAKTWASVPSGIAKRVLNNGKTSPDFQGNVENYVKGRMILGSGYNIDASYLFPNLFLLSMRYSHLTPDKNSFLNNTLYFNRNNVYELSVGKYLSRSHAVKLHTSFIYIDAGPGSRDVLEKDMGGKNEMIFQTFLQIAF